MSDIIPEGILYGNLAVGSGTTNYNDLDNKPQINSVTLQGNKTASELGLVGTSDIPVTSVNGETGAVVLDGTEINYQAGKTINQKIDEVEAEIPVVSYPVTSVNGETGAVVLDGTDIEYSSGVSVNSQIDTLMNYIPVYGNTASGAIATFDTSLALPLQDCTIDINAEQESGTPTPLSPLSITGFTGANVTQAPIYERVIATTLSTQTADGITLTAKTNGLIEVNGTATANGSITFNCNPIVIPLINGRTMRLNNSFSGGFTVRFFNGSTEIDYWALNTINRTVTNYAGMGGQTINKIVFAYSSGASVTNGTLLVDFIANSTTTAISWQSEVGTVYGGSLDVTTGKLTLTHVGKLITDTSLILDASTATVGFRASVEISVSQIPPADNQQGYNDQKSNVATYVGNAGSVGSNIGTNSFKTHTNGNIYFYLSGYNTLEDLKTYAQGMITANTPITFVWYLATPVTYQLTPTQINAIVAGGAKTTNNVFTDTNGNTSVVYACSLKDYIDRQ